MMFLSRKLRKILLFSKHKLKNLLHNEILKPQKLLIEVVNFWVVNLYFNLFRNVILIAVIIRNSFVLNYNEFR